MATVTSSYKELCELVPLLRDLYFSGRVELISLVTTRQESELDANPAVHRRLREYAIQPPENGSPLKGEALVAAARNALLEERPDVLLWPTKTFLKEALHATSRQLGIGEYQLGQSSEVSLQKILNNLTNLDEVTEPLSPGVVKPDVFMEPHWENLEAKLSSPCLVQTTTTLLKLLKKRFPEIQFYTEANLESYPCGLSLMNACYSEQPKKMLKQLSQTCDTVVSLEPVNSPIVGTRFNLCYGDYDNEFALSPPELDLKNVFSEGHQTEVWDARSGQAGPHQLPHPDNKFPAFFTSWPETRVEWTDRFAIPQGETLKIVFADSGNVACSALHHAEAVNRFTESEAWALVMKPHPFMGPKESDEHTLFLSSSDQVARAKDVLEAADCIVFFEDDDEESESWPFPLSPHLQQAAILHLYIGYRVHQKDPRLTRRGRRVLTPLPHLLKMYPGSHFYAGFPPISLSEKEPVEPQSVKDGICRFLHTPSRPHWTTSRYPYHKDTAAYLEAARQLKKKYGSKVEFHQIGGWSHEEVLRAREYCDVTFNQLRGFHGLSGDEALILGRPCVQFFDQININRHLEYWGLEANFPWISCPREELIETFEELVEYPEKRAKIGQQSREFMRKYFGPRKGILPLLYHCYRAAKDGPGQIV